MQDERRKRKREGWRGLEKGLGFELYVSSRETSIILVVFAGAGCAL